MNDIIKFSDVEKRVITLRGQKGLLDSDVAALYDVETKRVNEAVKNNHDKFPRGYFFELCEEEFISLRSKISTLKTKGRGQHTKYIPKAFTEKGLYMLATILKSNRATRTTIATVETFTKFRELTTTVGALTSCNDEKSQKSLMQKSSSIF